MYLDEQEAEQDECFQDENNSENTANSADPTSECRAPS